MGENRFDPSGYLMFDLARGHAGVPGAAAAVVVPVEVLERIVTGTGGDGAALIGEALGEWLGARLRERLASGGNAADASPESFVAELNGLLAVHGLGRAALESYGDALLVRVDPAVFAGGDSPFVESLFRGLFRAFLGRDVPCLRLDGPGGPGVLLGSPPAIRRAQQLKTAGVAPETIATRLHQESRALQGDKR